MQRKAEKELEIIVEMLKLLHFKCTNRNSADSKSANTHIHGHAFPKNEQNKNIVK